jgi:aspartate-semialdehyde dehydrogenase
MLLCETSLRPLGPGEFLEEEQYPKKHFPRPQWPLKGVWRRVLPKLNWPLWFVWLGPEGKASGLSRNIVARFREWHLLRAPQERALRSGDPSCMRGFGRSPLHNDLKGEVISVKISIAVLGATGPVGQKVISLLENHPRFLVAEVAASEGSVGQVYGERVQWKNEFPLDPRVAQLRIKPLMEVESEFVVSALPADVAHQVEPALASRGHIVCSNASAFRMSADVPLLIPEVNSSHLSLLSRQTSKGKILTNPNCSTVFLAGALKPLLELAEIEHVSAVTLQALSGAGYPGVPSFDLLGNIIPHIGGEEEKIRLETKRILGSPDRPLDIGVTVHVHRVPVVHGHTVAAHVRFKSNVSVEKVQATFRRWEERYPNFLKVHTADDRPQPARDLHPHDMRIHVGRIKQGDRPDTVGFISLGHNLVRGAAGAAIAILEAYLDQGVRR